MIESGPYRGNISSDEMRSSLELEGKFSIRLPEDIYPFSTSKEFPILDTFKNAIKSNVKPEDIAFYSQKTGIVRYVSSDKSWNGPLYNYQNREHPHVKFTIKIYTDNISQVRLIV